MRVEVEITLIQRDVASGPFCPVDSGIGRGGDAVLWVTDIVVIGRVGPYVTAPRLRRVADKERYAAESSVGRRVVW